MYVRYECIPVCSNVWMCPGDLLCVVGAVGSGKSSLLSALLGDLWAVFGSIAVKGKVRIYSMACMYGCVLMTCHRVRLRTALSSPSFKTAPSEITFSLEVHSTGRSTARHSASVRCYQVMYVCMYVCMYAQLRLKAIPLYRSCHLAARR